MGLTAATLRATALLGLSVGIGACRTHLGDPAYPDTRPAPSTIAKHAEYQAELQRARERKDRRLVWVDAKDIELPQTSDYDEPPDDREYTFYVWAFDPRDPEADVETMLADGRLVIDVVGVESLLIAPVTMVQGSALRIPPALVDALTKELETAQRQLELAQKAFDAAADVYTDFQQSKGKAAPTPDPAKRTGAPQPAPAAPPAGAPAGAPTGAAAAPPNMGSPPAEPGPSREAEVRRALKEAEAELNVRRREVKVITARMRPGQEDAEPAAGLDGGRLAPARDWTPSSKLRNVVMVKVRSQEITQAITIGAGFPRYYRQDEADRQRDLDDLYARLDAVMRAGSVPRPAAAPCAPCAPACGAPLPPPCDGPAELRTPKDYYVAIEARRERPNPFIDIKRVRVFNGDLHTQIYMLSNAEASDAFGEMFARYFYVGRTYFRNRHPDKTLVVNTTSLRARCLFYRQPDAAAARAFLREGAGQDLRRYQYLDQVPSNLIGARTAPAQTKSGIAKPYFEKLLAWARQKRCGTGADSSGLGAELDAYLGCQDWRPDSAALHPGSVKEVGRRAEARAIAEAAMAEFGAVLATCPVPGERQQQLLMAAEVRLRKRFLEEVAPVEFPLPLPTTPHDKRFAMSRNVYRQGMMAGAGYLFEDYYRPMTLRSVLVSLMAKTEQDPYNQTIRWLESLGEVGGALVGLDAISGYFGSRGFAQLMAFTTGVFIPEVRKLLLRDVEKFIANLSQLALETVIKISPGESTDGYVFLPKGAIFGFGIDEYGVSAPTFLVNIDNDDVSVDGLLVNAAHEFSSGDIDERSLMQQARQQGASQRREREKELLQMHGRIAVYQLDRLIADVQEALRADDKARAQRLIASYGAQHGWADPTGSLALLRATVDLPAAPTAAELEAGAPAKGRGRAVVSKVQDALGAAPLLELRALDPDQRAKEGSLSSDFPGPVYAGELGVTLTEPPRAGVPTQLRLRVDGNDVVKEKAILQFAVSRGLARTPATEQFATVDRLSLVSTDAEADGAPRISPWYRGFTVYVRVQLKEADTSKVTASLITELQQHLRLVLEDVSDPAAGPRDVRSVSLVLFSPPPK